MRGCRLVCLVLSLPLVLACFAEEALCLGRYLDDPVPVLFFGGLVGTMLFFSIVRLGSPGFIETFVHELAHMLMAYLTFNRVIQFVAKIRPPQGGEAGSVQPFREPVNFLVVLAPYYLPTFTLPFLVARLFVQYSGARIINLLIGATLGFHYVLFVAHFGGSLVPPPPPTPGTPRPISDTRRVGVVFSAFFCLIVGVLILMLVLNIVWGAEKQVLGYHFVNIWFRTGRYYKEAWGYVRVLVDMLL